MKQDREDIDWGKLRLIVGKMKREIGVSGDGCLSWNDEMSRNYIVENKHVGDSDRKSGQFSSSCKENKSSNISSSVNSNICTTSVNSNVNSDPVKEVSRPSYPDTSNKIPSQSSNEAVSSSSGSSDSGKRKRELPQWMACAQLKKENSQKRMKTNSLFK